MVVEELFRLCCSVRQEELSLEDSGACGMRSLRTIATVIGVVPTNKIRVNPQFSNFSELVKDINYQSVQSYLTALGKS